MLSRCIKSTLQESGVDTQEFYVYSTRYASTSAAKRMGVSVYTIRLTAVWIKQSETVAKFYNLDIIDNQTTFGNSIFQLEE